MDGGHFEDFRRPKFLYTDLFHRLLSYIFQKKSHQTLRPRSCRVYQKFGPWISDYRMQYVGQTCRTLQKRFGKHYRRIRKPKNNDTFLYQHFKRTGHSPNDVIVQPVEKISYDENSSVRFKNIKRFETELKWIKLLQTPFPLGFNDNIYHEGNISKMPDFEFAYTFRVP